MISTLISNLRGFFTTSNTGYIDSNGVLINEISYTMYIALFIFALALTYVLTLLLMKVAKSIGAVDKPNNRKIHSKPIPKLGGLAIFIAFIITAAFASVCHPGIAGDFLGAKSVAILVGMLVMIVLGIYDDLRHISWMWKFTFQIVAACIVIRQKLIKTNITLFHHSLAQTWHAGLAFHGICFGNLTATEMFTRQLAPGQAIIPCARQYATTSKNSFNFTKL